MIITTGRRLVFVIAAVATALLLALPFTASAQDRVALVVGNGAYAHALKLPNPPNDAADMTAALRDLGFEVISATDADKSAFDSALRDFARRTRGARTALFYYAGHGLQVASKNYAVPVDAKLEAAADLPVETVDIDQVLSVMQADENRINLVFLDACRDNPLTRSFARALPATRSASVGIGLSAVNAGRGTLIAYATAPNQVALDGARTRNSPFTAALFRHIGTPGLDIALVMRRVTADVEAASGGTQSPWVHASLTTDVVLKGGSAPAYSPSPAVEPVVAGVDPNARVAPRSEIAAPNEPLPTDITISPEVLKIVETHPFFANGPAVRINRYDVSSNTTSTTSGSKMIINSNDSWNVRWLRREIVQVEERKNYSVNNSGSIGNYSHRSFAVSVANGLLNLGYRMQFSAGGKTNTTTAQVLRIENMQGRIFPVTVGNRFSYDTVSLWKSTAPGGTDSEATYRTACEVTKSYEAKAFHRDLTGMGYLTVCENEGFDTTYGKSQSRSLDVFFDQLGIWLKVDPVLERERVVMNNETTITGKYKTVSNGSYTLKLFLLAR